MAYTEGMPGVSCYWHVEGHASSPVVHPRLCLFKDTGKQPVAEGNPTGFTYEQMKRGLMAHLPSVHLSVCTRNHFTTLEINIIKALELLYGLSLYENKHHMHEHLLM